MNKRKILFTDMDGTLLLNNSTVSPEMKEALDRMTAAGHRLVLSSGRPLDSILEVMEQEKLFYPDTLVISYNGSLVYDCQTRTPLLEHTVSFADTARIMNAARARGIHVQTYTDHEIVCEREDDEVRHYRSRIHLPLVTTPDPLSVLTHPPYKVHSIHLTDKQALEDLKSEVELLCQGRVTVQFSNDQYLEFFSRDSGKGNAILRVCQYFGIPVSDSVAAGDAPNDISMLRAAGIGVAMKNAAPSVKEAADYVTLLDNEHNGLAGVIARFFG